MQDGLYKISFQTPLGAGAGVVVLQGGQLRGGDSAIAYVGEYQQTGDTFTATARTKRHTAIANMPSVFGKDNVTIRVTGKSTGNSATLTGSSPDAPGVSFQAAMEKID